MKENEKVIETYGDAKRFLNAERILDAINNVVSCWLRNTTPFGDFAPEEHDRICSTALGAHFLAKGRIRIPIMKRTLNALVQELFHGEYSCEEARQFLAQEAPKIHLTSLSPRRAWFLEAKRDLADLPDPQMAEELAEMFYLMLAVLEAREVRGIPTVQ